MDQLSKDEFYKQLNSIGQSQEPVEPATIPEEQEDHDSITFQDDNNETIQIGTEEAEEAEEEAPDDIQPEAEEAESPKPKKESRYINRERLNEEIEKRNRIQQEFEAERRRAQELEAQIEAYNRIIEEVSSKKEMGSAQQEEQAGIDPLDVEAYQYFEKRIKDLESKLVNQNETLTKQQEEARIAQAVNHHEKEFMSKNPDFNEAFKHLMEAEKANHLYLAANEAQAAQMVNEKVKGILINAVKNGKNSAEIIYNMARNYGYAPKTTKKPGGPDFKAINKNMDRSASVSDIPSSAGSPSPRTYSNLEDFEQLKRPNGRGTDTEAFYKALQAVSKMKGM